MRNIPHALCFFALLFLVFPLECHASRQALTITGLVKRPLTLTVEDLAKFQSAAVRINDIRKGGAFHGVFTTQGVPLRNLLEVALVEKEASSYAKPVDLAIVVRDRNGKKVALSWGEVFYRNPSDVVIAYSAAPIMPHHMDCTSCHATGFSKPYLDQLSRTVSLPKLVMANDFDSDRSLEGIVTIEVVNLDPRGAAKKKGELFSPRMVVSGLMEYPVTIFSLDNLPRTTVAVNIVGEGKGFHGRGVYGGVPLSDLIEAVGIEPDLRSVVSVTSPDGYRSLVSWGELILSPQGQRIVIADEWNGKPIEKGGAFVLVVPDDLAADRDVKAVTKIEVHAFNEPARMYIIGMGPGDTDLMTREAVTCLGRTDAVVAPEKLYKTYAAFVADKPLLFDSMILTHKDFFAKAHPEIPPADVDRRFEQEREKAFQHIKKMLAGGQSIACLDWGDPLVYGSSRWIRKHFSDDEIVTVPGLSAFNAANAVLGRDVTCTGSLVMTTPNALKANEALLKAAADNGDTVVVFNGLRELGNLIPLFSKYFKEDTPAAIVYNAGISSGERRITGALRDIQAAASKEKEDFLGMIYVGPCLSGKSGK